MTVENFQHTYFDRTMAAGAATAPARWCNATQKAKHATGNHEPTFEHVVYFLLWAATLSSLAIALTTMAVFLT
jgi:hypothetical protein